jgi:hypothetical protein
MKLALIGIALLAVAAPLFWMAGGLYWLEKSVFPPKLPGFMPSNSVWIDAPALPISWHHGWWFGCGVTSTGAANYCRLVRADGEEIYAAEYLPCSDDAPMGENHIHLISPPDSVNMWLFRENHEGVIGFLANGDLLLPLPVRARCDQLRA